MKKILALLLSFGCSFVIGACSSGTNNSANSESERGDYSQDWEGGYWGDSSSNDSTSNDNSSPHESESEDSSSNNDSTGNNDSSSEEGNENSDSSSDSSNSEGGIWSPPQKE